MLANILRLNFKVYYIYIYFNNIKCITSQHQWTNNTHMEFLTLSNQLIQSTLSFYYETDIIME